MDDKKTLKSKIHKYTHKTSIYMSLVLCLGSLVALVYGLATKGDNLQKEPLVSIFLAVSYFILCLCSVPISLSPGVLFGAPYAEVLGGMLMILIFAVPFVLITFLVIKLMKKFSQGFSLLYLVITFIEIIIHTALLIYYQEYIVIMIIALVYRAVIFALEIVAFATYDFFEE